MYVPAKSPFSTEQGLRAYLEQEFHAIARAMGEPLAFYPRTLAERIAAVELNELIPYGQLLRYHAPVDGVSDMTPAYNAALNVAIAAAGTGDGVAHSDIVFPRGTSRFLTVPQNVEVPCHIRGPTSRTGLLIRDYDCADPEDGLINFRAGATTRPIGCKVSDLFMGTGSNREGGCLISVVQPSSGDGADGLLIDNIRSTNSFGLGGLGNGPDYQLYLDGSTRVSPLGLRGVCVRDSTFFGAQLGSVYVRSTQGFCWSNCQALPAGSLSGTLTLIGTPTVTSNDNSIMGGVAYGLVLDHLTLTAIILNEINGSVSRTADVLTTFILATGKEFLRELTGGGNVSTVRYDPNSARGGVYVAGSSGQAFHGNNLVHDTGNTFRHDKAGLAWAIGDVPGSGLVYLSAKTGAAGDSAGLHDASAALLRLNPGVAPHVPVYTVATLPSPALAAGLIYVSNEAGGAVLAFSDSANWRRVTDRAIVS